MTTLASALEVLAEMCARNAPDYALRAQIQALSIDVAALGAFLPPQLQVLWRSPELPRRHYNVRAEAADLRLFSQALSRHAPVPSAPYLTPA